MARILITMENSWYNEIRSLKNYNEKSIERRLLKHGESIFQDYYFSLCNFEFTNTGGTKSDPDIILISKDLKSWILVEVELTEKGMTHTYKQLDVFTDCKFNTEALVKYVIRQIPPLVGRGTQLKTLFESSSPEVLVVFDGYNDNKAKEMLSRYSAKIASIEVFKTSRHNGEALMIYGDYPYQVASYTFLKPVLGDYVHFSVSQESFFLDPRIKEIEVNHNFKRLKISVLRSNKKKDSILVKIPFNPFEPSKALILERSLNKQYFIKPL